MPVLFGCHSGLCSINCQNASQLPPPSLSQSLTSPFGGQAGQCRARSRMRTPPSDAVQREGDLKGVIATGLVVVWHDHDICVAQRLGVLVAPPILCTAAIACRRDADFAKVIGVFLALDDDDNALVRQRLDHLGQAIERALIKAFQAPAPAASFQAIWSSLLEGLVAAFELFQFRPLEDAKPRKPSCRSLSCSDKSRQVARRVKLEEVPLALLRSGRRWHIEAVLTHPLEGVLTLKAGFTPDEVEHATAPALTS